LNNNIIMQINMTSLYRVALIVRRIGKYLAKYEFVESFGEVQIQDPSILQGLCNHLPQKDKLFYYFRKLIIGCI
jgi:hypothetical protein